MPITYSSWNFSACCLPTHLSFPLLSLPLSSSSLPSTPLLLHSPPPHLQVSDTISTAEALLGDLAGFDSFRNEGHGLGEELRVYQREQLDQWSRRTLAAIDHPSESLRSGHKHRPSPLITHVLSYILYISVPLIGNLCVNKQDMFCCPKHSVYNTTFEIRTPHYSTCTQIREIPLCVAQLYTMFMHTM